MKKIPIIIDCDPGVDDSYAIALANSHPEFEIVALTAIKTMKVKLQEQIMKSIS